MSTDPSLTEFERDFYGKALANANTGAASTGYGQAINQRIRFQTFGDALGNVELQESWSLLDVGCGTGDLLDFADEVGIPLAPYVGIDRDERMIETARERWKDEDPRERQFWTGDVVDFAARVDADGGMAKRYDVVVSIAALALKPEGWHLRDSVAYAKRQIDAMTRFSSRLTFVTLFSIHKNNVLPTEMVIDPAYMLSWALERWPRVDLVHSYAPFDFSLAIYHEEGKWWKEYDRQS